MKRIQIICVHDLPWYEIYLLDFGILWPHKQQRKVLLLGPRFSMTINIMQVLGLQASFRAVEFKSVLSYKLAPVHTILFDDSCKIKLTWRSLGQSISKKLRQNRLHNTRWISSVWCIAWPASSTTNQVLVQNFLSHVPHVLQKKSNWSGCVAANSACTVFFNFQGSSVHNNEQTKEIAEESDKDWSLLLPYTSI